MRVIFFLLFFSFAAAQISIKRDSLFLKSPEKTVKLKIIGKIKLYNEIIYSCSDSVTIRVSKNIIYYYRRREYLKINRL